MFTTQQTESLQPYKKKGMSEVRGINRVENKKKLVHLFVQLKGEYSFIHSFVQLSII